MYNLTFLNNRFKCEVLKYVKNNEDVSPSKNLKRKENDFHCIQL